MASPTKMQLKADLKEILKGADLSQLSSKKVRKQLEVKYGQDLTDRKKEIDELLMALIESQQEKGSDHDDDEEVPNVSESDDSDLDEPIDYEPPSKKTKTPLKKPKKNTAAAESDDEADEVDDELLARQLQEEENGGRHTRRSASRRTPSKRTPKEGKVKKPSKNGYMKPALLSPALADIVGTDKMARNQVVKKMWEIARERNLFDPKNKRYIICDEELHNLFKKRRVLLFGCMKHLQPHIHNADQADDIL